jgi:hypothetical protein
MLKFKTVAAHGTRWLRAGDWRGQCVSPLTTGKILMML